MKLKMIVIVWLLLAVTALFYALRESPAAGTLYPKPVSKVKQVPKDPAAHITKTQNQQQKTVVKEVSTQTVSRIDIAFCLDTTGSMSGLIEGAKQKIWSIVNAVASAKPRPELRIGLVAYRDRGDTYVTRVYDFTSDLDAMFTHLRALNADGGGDTPEHVNRALHEAVYDLNWSEQRQALKIVYLVGDAPPHMDYQDRYDYRKIVRDANQAGITINTIQCGEMIETAAVWQKIANLADGRYIAIQQDGGMIAATSPYDEELARLSAQLNETYLAYGRDGSDKKIAQETNDREAMAMSPEAAAERAASKSSALYSNESWDLVDALRNNAVKLEALAPSELPEPLLGKSLEEQRAYVKEQDERRDQLQRDIKHLSAKRDVHVRKQTEKSGAKDGFDAQVLETLKDQAKEKGIEIER